jgi:hypothetical protein
MVAAAGSAGTEARPVTQGEQSSGLTAEHNDPVYRCHAALSHEHHQAAELLMLTGRRNPADLAAAENVPVLPFGRRKPAPVCGGAGLPP